MSNTKVKTIATDVPVEEFLLKINNAERKTDGERLCEMMSKITGKPPVMWGSSIIGFGQYHYKYESGREGDIGAVGFSPRAANLTIYLVDGVVKYKNELKDLGPHKTGKVCLYIKRLSEIDQDILEKIIKSSYQYVMSHEFDMHRAK